MSESMTNALKWDYGALVRGIPPSRRAIEQAAAKGRPAPKPVSYLPYPAVMAATGKAANLEIAPFSEVFGNAVLVVEFDGQRLQYPVLDGLNHPIGVGEVSSRDVSDNIHRAKAKAAALRGWGLGLYAGFEKPMEFLRALGVKPDSDLTKVAPLLSDKEGKPYIKWAAAIAAAGITDPAFRWDVRNFTVTDRETGEVAQRPYVPCGKGYLVAVDVTWKGVTHTEYLAIMGIQQVQTARGLKPMDFQTLPNPNAGDWNRAIMRCLTKGVAIRTGYGLSVYAREDIEDLEAKFLGGPRVVTAVSTQKGAAADRPKPENAAADGSVIDEIRVLLQSSGKSEEAMMTWLGKPGAGLESLDAVLAQRALAALCPRKAA